MAAYRELPEQLLSRNTARYLITRNAGEKELLKRTCFLLDKAKSEEEKDFERERDRLLLRHSKIQEIQTTPSQVNFNVGINVLCRNDVETAKWDVMTDTALLMKNRRKRGTVWNNKALNSSEVLLDKSSTIQYANSAIKGQASKRSATTFGCTLPEIQPSRTAYSQENKARKCKNIKNIY